MARLNKFKKDQKLKKDFLEALDTFLENFNAFWQILGEASQKERGRPLPPVLKIALKQYYEEQAARLAILLLDQAFTLEEAMQVLPEVTMLAYASEEKEKLEKILMASRL